MSKKTSVISVYVNVNNSLASSNWSRKDWVAHLSHEVKISNACASTYLSNIRSGKWSTDVAAVPAKKVTKVKTVKVVKSSIDEITAMSNKQLVERFNQFSPKPVARFRDHATAVKRTLAVCGLSGA